MKTIIKSRAIVRINELHESDLTASHGVFIKRPNHLRKTFSIIPYVRRGGKKFYDKPLNIHELNEINHLLISGKVTPINADRQIANLRTKIDEYLKTLSVDTSLGLNIEIAERYLKKKEAQSKNRAVSNVSYRTSMIQAVRLLGKKSLITDSVVGLQKEFDKNFNGSTQLHKNLANRVNTLLKKELGKTDGLVGKKPEPRFIRYITLKELSYLMSKHDNHDEVVLIAIGAYCGLRVGEIFGLTKKSLIASDVLFISRQKYAVPDADTGEIYGLPKGRKRRKTIIINGGRKYIDEFFKNGIEYYEPLRARLAERLRSKCLVLWPDDPEKQLIKFHELRDVFAVHLISNGSPIDSTAKLMGNSPAVCMENYSGFIASDREVDFVRAILNK